MSKLLALAGFAILTMGYVGFGSTSKASIGGIGVQQAQVATQTNASFGSDNCSFELFKNAITANESKGSYTIRAGKPDSKGRFAYGRYQVMSYNIGPWSEEHCGRKYSVEDFRNDPECQEKIFKGEVLKLYAKYGNWGDVASSWFSGDPLAGNNGKDAFGMTVPGYVSAVLNHMRKHSNECISTVNEKPQSPRLQDSEVSPKIAKESMDVLVQHLSGLPCNPPDLSGCGLGKAYRLSDGSIGLVEEHPPSEKVPRIHPGLSLFRAP